jgi:deoxyribodipyrimidine photo-lyase
MSTPDFAALAGKQAQFTPEQLELRVQVVVNRPRASKGAYVLYWVQMYRRAEQNAALEYAIAQANERKLPLVVYESLRVDYPYASDRFHRFVLEGAKESAAQYEKRGASYVFFLPKSPEEARGIVPKLSQQADLIVTDAYPTFIIPDHVQGLGKRSACTVVTIEDNTIIPQRIFPKEAFAARVLRPWVVKNLATWFHPLSESTCQVTRPWQDFPFDPLSFTGIDLRKVVAKLPIDHHVPYVEEFPGGYRSACEKLTTFLGKLENYETDHNHPDANVTSQLSPYLHFGMISAREVALKVAHAQAPNSAKNAFLEQLLVRRTLAFNLAYFNNDRQSLTALPEWAQKTITKHRSDVRATMYSREQLEQAATGDEVWNAAQRELLARGLIHNYVRMLWGKCVISWKKTPEEAFADLVYLNDKFALDGRDPNTYTNILWCFGKHDRAWGPERPILGTLRYMSTQAAIRKLRMKAYLKRWG